MSYFENETLWWGSVSAIGRWFGAFATFLAVCVSLYLARQDRSPEIRIHSAIIQNEKPYLLKLTTVNTGKVSIPMQDCFYLKTPNSEYQKIDAQELKHGQPLIVSGDYWEVYFDIPYLIARLKMAGVSTYECPQTLIVLEDHLGRRYQHRLPEFQEHLIIGEEDE